MKKGLTVILAAALWFQGASALAVNIKGEMGTALIKELNRASRGKITDAVVEIDGRYGCFGISGALGSLLTPTLLSSVKEELKGDFGIRKDDRFGLLWGSLSLEPREDFEVEAGVLTTMVGQELPPTVENNNLLFGLVWNAQPFIYKGVRVYSRKGDYLAYGEFDFGVGLNGSSKDRAFGLGLLKNRGKFQFGLNYFDYRDYKNLIDLSVGKSWKRLSVAVNVDYQWLDESPSKRGLGGALYIVPKITENFSIPIRLEAVKDFKNSGIYGFNETAYSFTVSPTYRINGHTFIRGEFGAVKSEEKSYETEALQIAFSF